MSFRDEQIVALYLAGATQRELGKRFGVSESRICQIVGAAGAGGQHHVSAEVQARRDAAREGRRRLREAAADERAARRQVIVERNERIRQAAATASSQGQLAHRFGLSQNRMSEILNAMGVTVDGRGIPHRSHRPRDILPDSPRVWVDEPKDAEPRRLPRPTCPCGVKAQVKCAACGRGLCEDDARMTARGIRCAGCTRTAAA